MEPEASHFGIDIPNKTCFPIVTATAFLNGTWQHTWIRLDYLRDFFRSLLDINRQGPTLEEIRRRNPI